MGEKAIFSMRAVPRNSVPGKLNLQQRFGKFDVTRTLFRGSVYGPGTEFRVTYIPGMEFRGTKKKSRPGKADGSNFSYRLEEILYSKELNELREKKNMP